MIDGILRPITETILIYPNIELSICAVAQHFGCEVKVSVKLWEKKTSSQNVCKQFSSLVKLNNDEISRLEWFAFFQIDCDIELWSLGDG